MAELSEKKERAMQDQVLDSLNLRSRSESFLQVLETIRQVAPSQITVLITGESGSGKEFVARAIHQMSPRRDAPLISVNCGAIPQGILESELFGHEKGSFTGASDTHKGYFEQAEGGTIFLDEIGEMPPATQVRLLRALEEKEFLRVGGTRVIKVDVRVLAATNKDLEDTVRRGEFRNDLFYRLNAVNIKVPPLRRRREDIRHLSLYFAQQICRENDIEFQGFSDNAWEIMEQYNWPGNIRELRNVVERLVILEKGKKIDREMLLSHLHREHETDRNLPMVVHKSSDQAERELIYRALLDLRVIVEEIRSHLLNRSSGTPHTPPRDLNPEIIPDVDSSGGLPPSLKDIEKEHIERVLRRFQGNRRKAAQALGIGERTLYRKLKEYDLEDR
jgi:DNA-binding NtrC family response regulator